MFLRVVLIFVATIATVQVADAWVTAPLSSSSPRSATTTTRTILHAAAAGSSTGPKATETATGYSLDGKEIRGPITPVGNILLVRVKETLQATTGGILLPDQSKEKPTEGLVIAAGPGRLHPFTGVRITNPVRQGMSVLYGKFDGRPVTYNDEECQVIRDDDVLLAYEGVTMKLDNAFPVRDYVLVKTDASGQDNLVTSSGVVVAAQVVAEQTVCQGKVVKVGEGRMASDGRLTKSPVAVGDTVKFKDYAGNDIYIEGQSYSVVKMVDILSTFAGGGSDDGESNEADSAP